jgi:hypothetical protein
MERAAGQRALSLGGAPRIAASFDALPSRGTERSSAIV